MGPALAAEARGRAVGDLAVGAGLLSLHPDPCLPAREGTCAAGFISDAGQADPVACAVHESRFPGLTRSGTDPSLEPSALRGTGVERGAAGALIVPGIDEPLDTPGPPAVVGVANRPVGMF